MIAKKIIKDPTNNSNTSPKYACSFSFTSSSKSNRLKFLTPDAKINTMNPIIARPELNVKFLLFSPVIAMIIDIRINNAEIDKETKATIDNSNSLVEIITKAPSTKKNDPEIKLIIKYFLSNKMINAIARKIEFAIANVKMYCIFC